MDIAQLIKDRRTIHNYSTEAIDPQLIDKALELILWAPNHKLTHPWRLISIGSQCRSKLAELAVEIKSQKELLSEAKQIAIRQKYLSAPALISVGLKRSSDPAQVREDYASVAAGLQNAALFLWSHGIGTKWSTGKYTNHPKTYEWLNVDPNDIELVGFFWIGRPEKIPSAPKRPSLDECLRRGD